MGSARSSGGRGPGSARDRCCGHIARRCPSVSKMPWERPLAASYLHLRGDSRQRQEPGQVPAKSRCCQGYSRWWPGATISSRGCRDVVLQGYPRFVAALPGQLWEARWRLLHLLSEHAVLLALPVGMILGGAVTRSPLSRIRCTSTCEIDSSVRSSSTNRADRILMVLGALYSLLPQRCFGMMEGGARYEPSAYCRVRAPGGDVLHAAQRSRRSQLRCAVR